MKKIYVAALLILLATFLVSACSLRPEVTRVEENKQVDLSGYWNDTDSRMVAEAMIADAVSYPWLKEFEAKHNGEAPKIVIGTIRNKSYEHINIDTFMNDIQKELIKQGKVKFLVSKQERDEVSGEQEYQVSNPKIKSGAKGDELGADFMIQGEISSILDEAGKLQVRYYQIDLEFVNIATHEKVWIGQKKIKKVIRQPGL